MARKSRSDPDRSEHETPAWIPGSSDMDWFFGLHGQLRQLIEARWPGRWAGAVDRAVESTSVGLLVSTSSAMNGSIGAFLDVLDFCHDHHLPIPPALHGLVSDGAIRQFRVSDSKAGPAYTRAAWWPHDKRLAVPIDRIRFEYIDLIKYYCDAVVENEATVVHMERWLQQGDLQDGKSEVSYCPDGVARLRTEVDHNKVPFVDPETGKSLLDDPVTGEPLPFDPDRGVVPSDRFRAEAAARLFIQWKGDLPFRSFVDLESGNDLRDFDLSREFWKRLGTEAGTVYRSFLRTRDQLNAMIRLPPRGVELGAYLNQSRRAIWDGAQVIWPGRHYIPSDRTLERLGWDYLIRAIRNADIPSDAPHLHRAS
jgi:hypothetical protein